MTYVCDACGAREETLESYVLGHTPSCPVLKYWSNREPGMSALDAMILRDGDNQDDPENAE